MAQEFTSASGAQVVINMAPFDDAFALKNAIMRQLSAAKLPIDFENIKASDELDVGSFIKMVAGLDADPDVNEALKKCLIKCTWNGRKIDKAVFEEEGAREDYYEIAIACLKVNVGPFFKGALSKLSTFSKGNGLGTLKSKLGMNADSSPSN